MHKLRYLMYIIPRTTLYQEIFKKRINCLDNLPEYDKRELLVKINDAYSKERISELHYTPTREEPFSL